MCFLKENDLIWCCITLYVFKYTHFYMQPFFSTQILLRCPLIHISNIILRFILYLIYLCSCQGLALFMYLCDLFFILSFISIVINHITLFKQKHLFCVHIFRTFLLFLDNNVDENANSSASGCCLVFAWFFAYFSLALLIKVFLIKRSV